MKRIIIFGSGDVSKRVLQYEPKAEVEILFICDNNTSKWGKYIGKYEIVSPQRITDAEFDIIIICLIDGRALNEVYEQLLSLGIPENKIQFSFSPYALGICQSPLEDYFIVPAKEIKPFKKGPAEIYSDYEGETARCHDRREREGFFEKYCKGDGLDIGYGADLIVPGCSGWDLQNGDAQYLDGIEDDSFDFVYSSHCLEHVWNVRVALKNWFRVLRKGGYLIIAIPHRDLYEKKKKLPSRWNGDHKHMFLIGKSEAPDTLDIVEEIRSALTDFDIKYVKTCDEGFVSESDMTHSRGEYQIEIVIQKK